MERLKFKINASFWVFVVMAAVFRQGYLAIMYSIAVVLHEFAHYFVAKKLFYRCNEIQVSIFGAVLYGEFQDICGTDRIKIALAGPLCNLALCLVCLASWWVWPEGYYFTEPFFTSNIGMACINLLPCYPLDGGRIVTGALERKFGTKALRLTKIFTLVFSLLAFAIFLLSLITGHNLFSVGLFGIMLFSGVFAGGSNTCYTKTTLSSRRRFIKKGMEKKTLVFDKNSMLRDVAKRMQGNYVYCLEVVDADMNVCKTFSVAQLEELVLCKPLDTRLDEID
ncbi:MAG: hypothetical protein NC132_01820 [Corallococcus sp.]|nr:hypothetical protein [Corallococcus sp.]MCM1359396.1 hypothetical protein [Corallococcus sp.]MCM1394839.1 hypothetical protein [Corallococcus sp.]